MLPVGLALAICIASPAAARDAVGINITGLSWHPSIDGAESFNPGLGVRYEFERRPAWKADAIAGGYRDSALHLALHLAVGVQRRLAGPLLGGAHLFAVTQGSELGRIYVAPLPSATIETGPVDLNFHYIPRVRGFTGRSAALGFHVTIWPFGGRGAVTTGPRHPESRFGLEFAVASGPQLTALTGRTVSARWMPDPRYGWRAGLDFEAGYMSVKSTHEYTRSESRSTHRYSRDEARTIVQIQHVRMLSSASGTRLFAAAGPQLHYHAYNGNERWRPGLVFGLGAEVDLLNGLALLGEYTTSLAWGIEEDLWLRSTGATLHAGTRLGVVLSW